ncbi:hypothetical protein AB7315_06040 [Providencia manganoxydans]|uniref:hypothetical protein n=1 Tax=Providencia manganoxydans TaxID=2923283 RepID=UPI0029C07ADF|nr:hypothetical protein [Providencia manganoxydans]MDX4944328.1 hypothetical protein [Providencia manganoxydans]
MSKPTGKLIRLTANDVDAYTKAESDTKIADAKKAGTDAQTTANAANTNATNANNNANGRVPNTRKVNNKALSADITITASDVGAYTKAESDTKIADAKKAGTDAQTTANTANTNATNANNNANGRVPNTRKVNNKALSADITITASDVGAYTKAEVDTKVNSAKNAANPTKRRSIWTGNVDRGGTITLPESINGKHVMVNVNGKFLSLFFCGAGTTFSESFNGWIEFEYNGDKILKNPNGSNCRVLQVMVCE